MLIERICPGLVPAIRQVFAVPQLVNVDDAVRALVTFGDCALGLGALLVVLSVFTAWIGLDVVRFIRRQRIHWGKNAA
jgi:hypothetical protein